MESHSFGMDLTTSECDCIMNKYSMENYNFEFDTSFDFEAIPVPPGLVNDRMVGLHIDWDRSLRGLILNRDVRETLGGSVSRHFRTFARLYS
jgi:hypothetical protein